MCLYNTVHIVPTWMFSGLHPTAWMNTHRLGQHTSASARTAAYHHPPGGARIMTSQAQTTQAGKGGSV